MGIKTTINIDAKTVDEILCKYIAEKYNIRTRSGGRFDEIGEATTIRTYWDTERNVTVVVEDAPNIPNEVEFPFRINGDDETDSDD